jgi:hypothetical protein
MIAADLRDALAMARQDAEKFRERDDVMGASARLIDLRCKAAEVLAMEFERGTPPRDLLHAMCVEVAACLAAAIASLVQPESRDDAAAEALAVFGEAMLIMVELADGDGAIVVNATRGEA